MRPSCGTTGVYTRTPLSATRHARTPLSKVCDEVRADAELGVADDVVLEIIRPVALHQ
jgi:hypothetical protein